MLRKSCAYCQTVMNSDSISVYTLWADTKHVMTKMSVFLPMFLYEGSNKFLITSVLGVYVAIRFLFGTDQADLVGGFSDSSSDKRISRNEKG